MTEKTPDTPFPDKQQVVGISLPTYLKWAAGGKNYKPLVLPTIQRGFVWKPKQIVELWDSLLRGMPIGSLMVSNLSGNQTVTQLSSENRTTENLKTDAIGLLDGQQRTLAIGLLDGQQRTLAMLVGWQGSPNHCVWIDLGEKGKAGAPFELRITTKTQPFGFQRHSHEKFSRYERKKAREFFDKNNKEHISLKDYELFGFEECSPKPWKGEKFEKDIATIPNLCIPLQKLWSIFKENKTKFKEDKINELENFLESCKEKISSPKEKELYGLAKNNLKKLHETFEFLEELQVPLVLIPKNINGEANDDDPAPLTLLFERIGTTATKLSNEDLLYSMIKQSWAEAHDLVEKIHETEVGYLMSATDCVMTAYRLAAAEVKIADDPRPIASHFHKNLAGLIAKGENGSSEGSLRAYLKPQNSALVKAFKNLYDTLKYQGGQDIGLPDFMLPHLSKGLIQVLLRWFILNNDSISNHSDFIKENRNSIIAFSLFWHMNIVSKSEDKASKIAFEEMTNGDFPANKLYETLTKLGSDGKTGFALPLIEPTRLQDILEMSPSEQFRANDDIFKKDANLNITIQERDLYKRFCWWRKPILLWLQREYVNQKFKDNFKGLTDEDTVPYDYDHLCPQNHWGSDLRNITIKDKNEERDKFRDGRWYVGNSIGNLHVLDSSDNRSVGDASLVKKIGALEENWNPKDSLLYLKDGDKDLWEKASPYKVDKKYNFIWDKERLASFQKVVVDRAFCLYSIYFEACKCIMPPPSSAPNVPTAL